MTVSEQIKSYGLELGYHAVGIAPATPFPEYEKALAERSEDYSWGMETGMRLKRAIDPRDRLPEAKSIVVGIYDYFREQFPERLVGRIGRMYLARCYNAPTGRLGNARVELMRQFLNGKGMQVGRWYGPATGVSDRLAAVRAGMGQYGRNTFVAAPGIGSFICIHTFIVDAQLDYDRPLEGTHCPPDCRACVEACPIGAIVADFRMNPRRCIAFQHFARVDGVRDVSTYVEPGKMGCWVHGCDVCQEACPRNQRKLRARLPASPFLMEVAKQFDLAGLLELNEHFQTFVVAPIMAVYLKDRKYLQRNAAIALGNSGDRAAVAPLSRALEENAEELVRGHAAWALGRLGGAEARKALERARANEAGDRAKEEIAIALETA